MLMVPQISTSHALGNRLSLIMLMTVQGTTPKYSSSDVQHWIAVIFTLVSAIQPSMTAPSFAILIRAESGTLPVDTYFLMADNLSCAASSVSFIFSMRPRTSDRSSVTTEMPLDS